jgi:hypothetical protein
MIPNHVILGLDKEEDLKYISQTWTSSSENNEGSEYWSSGRLIYDGLWPTSAYNIRYDPQRKWFQYRSHDRMHLFECMIALCDGCFFSWIIK